LLIDGEPGVEKSVRESHIHSEKLLTLVQDVLQAGGTGLQQLDAIAISIGPGSFTGLRIGLSTAKGLSFALDKPLVAVQTFEAIASAARLRHNTTGTIFVLVDAKKEEWYMGRFLAGDGTLLSSGPVAVVSLGETVSAVKGAKATLILTDKVDEIRRSLDIGVTIEDVHACCRGDVVASLAHSRILKKEYSDAATLEPMYLKDFVIRPPGSIAS
jgi:tRNA threonylcarbamoyladenosine biosynthesis protein TsaB